MVELTQHHRAIYDTEAIISSLRWFKNERVRVTNHKDINQNCLMKMHINVHVRHM